MRWVVLLALVGCVSVPGTDKDPSTDLPSDSDPPVDVVDSDAPVDPEVGRRVIRRLTGPELEATVRDAFQLLPHQWTPELAPDPASADGFPNHVDRLEVSSSFAATWAREAADVASVVAATLDQRSSCYQVGDRACAAAFVSDTGRRLFRRPLEAAETDRYLAIYDDFAGEVGFDGWAEATVRGLLQSPHMLYRTELGASDGTRWALTHHELSSALAYAYTGGPPGEALLTLADEGGLDSREAVVAEAERLAVVQGVATPAFSSQFLAFTSRWLGYVATPALTKDPVNYGGWGPELGHAMRDEADMFFVVVALEERGGLTELLTRPETWVTDPALAQWYGTAIGAVAREPAWGAGMLALGGVQTVHATANTTSPTQRGVMVRERVLCEAVPAPPPDIPELPPFTAATTTRERYEQLHAGVQPCAACHILFDPIGFGFEGIDAAGRLRVTENGFPVDTTGVLAATDGSILASFAGPAELVGHLADQPSAGPCFASWAGAWVFGVSHGEAAAFVPELGPGVRDGSLDAVGSFVALAGTDHFRFRGGDLDEVDDPGPTDTDVGDTDPVDTDPVDSDAPDTDLPTIDSDPGSCGIVCTVLPAAPASDEWCQTNCTHDPPFCPPELCVCEDIPC